MDLGVQGSKRSCSIFRTSGIGNRFTFDSGTISNTGVLIYARPQTSMPRAVCSVIQAPTIQRPQPPQPPQPTLAVSGCHRLRPIAKPFAQCMLDGDRARNPPRTSQSVGLEQAFTTREFTEAQAPHSAVVVCERPVDALLPSIDTQNS